ASFEEVRQQVRWHYQWVLATDFLPTVIQAGTFSSIFPDRYHPAPVPALGLSRPGKNLSLMPVEFSVAPFRFGHSMILPHYRLHTRVEGPMFSKERGNAADLAGFRPIPANWAIDWQFFIDLEDGAEPRAVGPPHDSIDRKPQMAYKIDTSLASP